MLPGGAVAMETTLADTGILELELLATIPAKFTSLLVFTINDGGPASGRVNDLLA